MGLFQALNTVIPMQTVSSPTTVTGNVWFDGSHLWINIAGTNYRLDHPSTSAWTVSGVTPNRTYDASTPSLLTLTQSFGTLMVDLQAAGYIS